MADRETLRFYLGAQSALGPRWDAEGSRLCFVWNATGRFQAYAIGEPGGTFSRSWPIQISSHDRGTNPRWLADGSMLFTADVGGNECFQIYHADPDGRVSRLSPVDGAKYRVVHADAERFLFISNDQDKSHFGLYEHPYPVTVWAPVALFAPEHGVIQAAEPLPDGRRLVVSVAHNNAHHELWLVGTVDHSADATGTPATHSLTAGARARFEVLRAFSDQILVATDAGSDMPAPATLGFDGSLTPLGGWDPDRYGEVTGSAYTEGAESTYLTTTREGYSQLLRLDHPSAGELGHGRFGIVPVGLPFDGVIVSGDARTSDAAVAVSSDGAGVAVTLSAADRLTNVWTYAPSTESWEQTTFAGAPGLAAEEFCSATLHHFTSSDGERIPYFRVSPREPATGPLPAVLIIHGGPEAQFTPSFNPLVQFLAAQGLIVLAPNIRGSAGYGRRYLDLDNREKRLDAIRDIAELADHVTHHDAEIDGSRLAVFGGSYGGFAVLSAMTEYPQLWRAGVDIVGISNFVTFLRNTAAWRRGLREAEYGSLDDISLLEQISPIHRIEHLTAPLLIIQGDNDERVPLSESLQIYERLQALGRTVELLRFADEGHGVTTLENRISAYSRAADWLKTYL